MIVADFIKQVNKNLIILPINMFQFNSYIIGTEESPTSEEERRIIIFINYLPVLICDNRSKLLKITDHQQLNAAKWKITVFVSPQYRVDRVKCICPHHAYLINNKQVKTFDYITLFTAHFITNRILFFCRTTRCVF